MLLFLRSLLFYLGMILSLLLFLPFPILLLPFPFRYRYRILTLWGSFVLWWLEKTCRLTYQVVGTENIPKTAAIILSKHQSAWETFALAKIFPPQIWVLKRELLWIPIFGWGLACLEAIAIRRQKLRQSMQEIVEQGKQRLNRGLWIVIFPEGTRVAPGERKHYGIGGALLATQSGYPIVPVALNSGVFWPRQSFIKRPGTIQVKIGPLIKPEGKNYQEMNKLAEQWIEETMLTLPS